MRLLAFALAVMATFASFGINRADSVKVFFRVGQYRIDPSLGENREEMDRCLEALNAYPESDIDHIVVRAYTSPDGSSSANELLARQRCDAIADYLVANSGIKRDLIRKMPEGIAWDALRELVKDTPDVPARNEVLEILDNTPVWVFDAHGKVVSSRKSRLMALKGGVPYNWMLRNLFPQLRNAVAIVVVTKDGVYIEEKVEVEEPVEVVTMESVETSDNEELPIIPASPENPEVTDEGVVEVISTSDEPIYTEDRFALKTNLLYYAALMPNLELEYRFNHKWSVAVEGDIAWWGKGVRKYRLAFVTPEVRYRFKSGEMWRGMYVGLFAGPGLYDLENRGNGYEGEGVMVGASFGYSWPIARRLSLEAGVGIGYIYTRYKEYKPLDGHFLYQFTKDLNYFGPLRLRLSLVWRFGHRRVHSSNTKSVI